MISKLIIISVLTLYCMAEEDITAGPPPYDKPWVAGWGYNKSDPKYWNNLHLNLLKQTEDNKEKIKVVFLGDSRTYFWLEEGKQVWDKYYVKRGAFNYGIRGDSTRQVLWRIENKELEGLTPQLLVFMIGGNNLKKNFNRGTDEEIVKGINVIIEKLRQKLPKTKIIVIEEVPRKTSDERAVNINNLLEKEHGDGEWVYFLNPYKNFTKSNGKQDRKLYVSDGFHLNGSGYNVLAEILEPLIKQQLNE